MRIKKIEVQGFKSFAEREVVSLDDRVTGIIGPNGCGKSNIVDAIRWCLGEQRAKHLRGSGMGDVIFSGSSARGPAPMAEVSIVFDNEGDAAPPYAQYAELAVTRRLFRDGTSEYLINKVPCRLRDINDLLSGTGIGTKGYSIIEQGRVGQIVTSKPENRRQIIDEAAGITKFKAQKVAAERKIAQTQANLLRVTDVIGELEGRLSTLKRQAQKAERYKRYRGELRDLELWAASHQFLEFEVTGQVLAARRVDLSDQVGALRNELATRETQIEAERTDVLELEKALSARQEALFGLENKIQLLEQDRKFQLQERDGLVRSNEQSRAEIEAIERALGTLEDELTVVEQQHKALANGGEGGNAAERAQALAAEHETLVERAAALGAAIDEARTKMGRLESEAASVAARHLSLEEGATELAARVEQQTADTAELRGALEGHQTDVETARAALEQSQARVAALKEARAELDRERVSLKESVRSSEVAVETSRKELVRARSRLQSLEEIQSRYRSCQSGVQVVMEHRERLAQVNIDGSVSESSQPVLGIMADFIASPERYESAVSAVLGDRLQGVVVDAPAVGAGGVELLKELQEGRTHFLPRAVRADAVHARLARELQGRSSTTSPWKASEPGTGGPAFEVVDLSDTPDQAAQAPTVLEGEGIFGRLVDLVEIDPAIKPLADVLLGDALVVDGLKRALEIWDQQRPEQSLVTLDGDRVEPSGVVVGGSADALDSALLQQKREITELGTVVRELEGELETARAKHAGLEERLAEVERGREASEGEVLEAEKERVAVQQRVGAAQAAVERTGREWEQAKSRLDTARETAERRATELEALAERKRAIAEQLPELRVALEENQAAREATNGERETVSAALTEARIAQARHEQERDAIAGTRLRLRAQAGSERDRVARLKKVVEESEARIEAISEGVTSMGLQHGALLGEHKETTSAKHDASEAYEAARLGIENLELSIRNLRNDLDGQREALSEVELGLRELDLERSHVVKDVRERFGVRVQDVLVDYHHRSRVTTVENKRRAELKKILGRMGEVNLTAIKEYEEVSTRYEYLTNQRADLEDAINQLEDAIEKINETTVERFRETFDLVNDKFQQIFPRLFNGGHAQLVLTDPSDLLATGVEIMAQPPGKKVTGLELLSGGEKALTAVSLIFGIFLIKPSPFCLLDEVDAPLDEANVGRFCNLVRELSERTQFIIITHNKRTMESGDRLYGVTMQQRGISKLVSVNLTRAVEQANIARA